MKNKDKNTNLEKAKEYVFLLFKFRPRTEREIFARLKKKNFSDDIIGQTIFFLKEKGFINDSDFAKIWIDSRIKKPLGLRRIKQELQLKGIDKEIIDKRLEEIKKEYREEEIVRRVLTQKLKALQGVEPSKIKARLYGYLLRRGFSPDVVTGLLQQI